MVAVIAGEGLGLLGHRVTTGLGSGGGAVVGQSGGGVYVNAATGNLVVQQEDEVLLGLGRSSEVMRTYNSQGALDDDNGDGFRFGFNQKLEFDASTLNQAGSVVTRVAGDGRRVTYQYDRSLGYYVASEGDGSHDSLRYQPGSGDAFVWTEGSSQAQEIYDSRGALIGEQNALTPGRVSISRSVGQVTLSDASGQRVEILYDSRGNATQVTTLSSGVTQSRVYYSYDSAGRLSQVSVDLTPEDGSITDGQVYTTTYGYDGDSHRLASIGQSDGTMVAFQYVLGSDNVYRVSRVTQGTGSGVEISDFSYDLANHQTTITQLDSATATSGPQTVLTFDTAGRLTGKTGPAVDGTTTSQQYQYAADGNLTRVTDALGHSTDYRYDSRGNLLEQEDSLGYVVRYTYNDANQRLTETHYQDPDADGIGGAEQPQAAQTQRWVYDAQHHLRFSLDAQGGVTEYRYNAQGLVSSQLVYSQRRYDLSGLADDALPSLAQLTAWAGEPVSTGVQRTDYQYDFRGQLSSQTAYAETDAVGNGVAGSGETTYFIYDQRGHLLKQVNPGGVAPVSTAATAPSQITYRAGNQEVLYAYDGEGRRVSQTDALGVTTVTNYQRNSVTTTASNGLHTRQIYDGAGLLIEQQQSQTAPGTSTVLSDVVYGYDGYGNRVRSTDALGNVTHYLYDARGQLRFTVDPTGSITEQDYDADGRVVRQAVYAKAYDLSQPMTEAALSAWVADAANQDAAHDAVTQQVYDARGQVQYAVDAQGVVTEYTYDAEGRVTDTRHYGEGVSLATVRRMRSGNPTDTIGVQAEDGDLHANKLATNNAGYTGRGFLDYVGEGQADYQVQAQGGQYTLTVRYSNNSADRPLAVVVNGRTVGELHFATTANWATWTQTSLQLHLSAGSNTVSLVTQGSSGPNVDNLTFTGSGVGGVDTSYPAPEQHTRTLYDSDGRVLYQVDSLGQVQASTYDAAGQLIREVNYAQAYDLSQPITQATLDAWTADAAHGSPLDQTTTYRYDDLGQLRFKTDADGQVTEYRYDAQGRVTDTLRYAAGTDAGQLAAREAGPDETLQLQAEAGTLNSNQVATNATGYTGSGFVDYVGEGQVDYSVKAQGGHYTLAVRYSNDGADRPLAVVVNGQTVGQLSFPSTGSLSTWSQSTLDLYLAAGTNTLSLVTQGSSGPNIDSLTLTGSGVGLGAAPVVERHERTLYDADGQTLFQVDSLGDVTGWTYDSQGNRTQQTRYADRYDLTQPMTEAALSTWAAQHQAGNSITRNFYNVQGECLFTLDADGDLNGTTYNAQGAVVSRTHYGQAVTLAANATLADVQAAAAAQVSDPATATTTELYDAAGRLRFTLGNGGEVSERDYDAVGRLTRTVDYLQRYDLTQPLTTAALSAWVADGSHQSAGDAITQHYYDADGNEIYTLDADGYLTALTYNASGQVTASTRYTQAFSLGRLVSQADLEAAVAALPTGSDAPVQHRVYDAEGQLRFTVNAQGGVTETDYDLAGHVIRQVVYATAYDPTGAYSETALSSWAADPKHQSSADAITQSYYDALGQKVGSLDADGRATLYSYDAVGNLVAQGRLKPTLSLGRQASFEQFMMGMAQLQSANPNLAATTETQQMAYDAEGRLRFSVDSLGQVVEHQYDSQGRVSRDLAYAQAYYSSTDYSEAALSAWYADRAHQDTAHDEITQHFYDAAGREIYTLSAGGQVSEYRYNSAGQVTGTIQHAGLVNLGRSTTLLALQKVLAADTTDAPNDQQSYRIYDAEGRLRFQLDSLGDLVEYRYDSLGRVTREIAYATPYSGDVATARETTLSAWVADASHQNAGEDRVTQHFYDAAGQEIYTLDAAGYATARVYNAAGQVVQRTRYAQALGLDHSAAGTVTADQVSAAIAAKADASRDEVQHNVYDDLGQLRYQLNGAGDVTEQRYDAEGRVTETLRYAQPYTGKVTLAALSTLTEDAQTRVTRQTYDALGQVLSQSQRLVNADGSESWLTETYAYDSFGNRIAVTDARGDTTTYAYDKDNRLVAELRPRDAADDPAYKSDPSKRMGYVTRYQYDAFGNRTGEVQSATAVALTGKTAVDYASAGVTANTDAVSGDQHKQYTYDTANRQIRVSQWAGTGTAVSTRTDYDAFGNVVQTVAAEGLPEQRVTRYAYDALNRVVQETRGYGSAQAATTGYAYDAFGQVTVVIDPRGYELALGQSSWSLATRQRIQQMASLYMADKGKAPASLSSAERAILDSLSSTFKDNAALLSVLPSTGALTGDSNKANFRTALEALYTRTQAFDQRGNKVSETDAQGNTTTSAYDAFGNLVQTTDPNGASGYFYYDSANRLRVQVDPAGYAITHDYNAVGQEVAKRQYATALSQAVDSRQRWSDITALLGKVANDSQDAQTVSTYDDLGRLTRQSVALNASQTVSDTYVYDAQGNKTQWTDRAGHVYQYRYDAQGNLLQEVMPTVSVVTDGNGTVAQRQLVNRYQYDAFGNQTQAIENGYLDAQGTFQSQLGTQTTNYRYDGWNRQVEQRSAAVAIEDGGQSYSQAQRVKQTTYDALGNVIATQDGAEQAGKAVGAQHKTAARYDALGRQTLSIDATGAVTQYEYDPAGNQVAVIQYGQRLTAGYADSDIDTILAQHTGDTDAADSADYSADYRETQSFYDGDNRLIGTRSRGEASFDMAAQSLTPGATAYTPGYSTSPVQTYRTYDANGNRLADVDGRGNVTRYFYDVRGQKVGELAAAVTPDASQPDRHTCALTTWAYDAFGHVTQQTRYAYEALNPGVTDSLDTLKQNVAAQRTAAEQAAAGVSGNLADLSDADVAAQQVDADRVTTYTYDALGRKLTQSLANVSASQLSNGAPTAGSATTATTTYAYDNLDRQTAVITPGSSSTLSRETDTTYDALGRKLQVKGAQFTDYLGNLVRPTTEYAYDAAGDAVQTTRVGSNTTENEIQRASYNALGAKVSETDGTGAKTDYQVDIFGNATVKSWSQTDPGGVTTTYSEQYVYDGQNRQVKKTDAEGLSHETRYNAYGEIAAKGVNGQYQEQYRYDHLGRLFSTNADTGKPRLYLYDKAGNATAELTLVNGVTDANGNPVDLASLSPEQVLSLNALQTQMKVSIYDGRNRQTDVIDAPEDYQKLVNQGVTETQTPTDTWSAGINPDSWVPSTSDVTQMFSGSENPDLSSVTWPSAESSSVLKTVTNTNGTSYMSSVPNANPTPTITAQTFGTDYHLTDLASALGINSQLTALGTSLDKIDLTGTSATAPWEKSYWEGNPNSNALYTKTTVRLWLGTDGYVYRDLVTENYFVNTSEALSAADLTALNTVTGDTYEVTSTTEQKGTLTLSGHRSISHALVRAKVQLEDQHHYSPTASNTGSIIQDVPESKFTISVNQSNDSYGFNPYTGHPSTVNRYIQLSVHLPARMASLGADIYVQLIRNGSAVSSPVKWDGSASTPVTLSDSLSYAGDVNQSPSVQYWVEITASGLGNIGNSSAYSVSGADSGTSSATISGSTYYGYLVINKGSISSLSMKMDQVGVMQQCSPVLANNRYYVSYAVNPTVAYVKASGGSGQVLVDGEAHLGVASGYNSADISAPLVVRWNNNINDHHTVQQVVISGAASQAGPDDIKSKTQENDLTRTLLQQYQATWQNQEAGWSAIHKRQRYNAFGEVVESVDGNGNQTHYRYDAEGHLVTKIEPKVTVAESHGTNGHLDTLEAHPVTRYFYDDQGQLIATEDANSDLSVSESGYSDGKAFYTTQAFAGGLRTTQTDALGYSKQSYYDALGNQRILVDEAGHARVSTYDKANRLTGTRLYETLADYRSGAAAYSTTTYRYDEQGNRISDTNSLGFTEKDYFDGEGRVVKHVSFDDHNRSTAYDANVTTYSYTYDSTIGNGLGGYKKTTHNGLQDSSGADNTSFELTDWTDYFGKLRQHQDLGGHLFTYTYNEAGWLLEQKGTTATTNQTLANDSHLAAQSVASRTDQDITYEYYNNGLLKGINDSGTHSYTRLQYDHNGNIVSEIYNSEPYGGLDSSATSQTALPYQSVTATYDALNRIETLSDYDYNLKYYYDAVGNRRGVETSYDTAPISDKSLGQGKDLTQNEYYLYDKDNRFIVTQGQLIDDGSGHDSIGAGTQGYAIRYNALGQRVYMASDLPSADGSGNVSVQNEYSYDLSGALKDTLLYDPSAASADAAGYRVVAERANDTLGRTTTLTEYSLDSNGNQVIDNQHTYQYNGDNTLLSDQVTYAGAKAVNHTSTYSYLGDGETLKAISTTGDETSTTTYDYGAADRWDSYKQDKVEITQNGQTGDSLYGYDANGHIDYLQDYVAKREIVYVNNQRGQVLKRTEYNYGDSSASSQPPIIREFFYLNGIVRGDMGSDATPSRVDYVQQLATEKNSGYSAWNRETPVSSADFDQNFQPINRDYPGRAPTEYTVQSGDTLSSIAGALWGDSSLWYLIADANGLSGNESLKAGSSLVIPNVVTNIHNTADTYRPYDTSLALGDTTPTLPQPPPPAQQDKCGGFQILVAVVAIVVTAYTGGLAATALGPALGSMAEAAGAAVGAAAGSAVSQGMNMAAGYQNSFSVGAMGKAALEAGVTAGLTEGLGSVGESPGLFVSMGDAAVQSLVGSATGSLIDHRQHFSWSGVAASALTAGVAQKAGLNGSTLPKDFQWGDVATLAAKRVGYETISHGLSSRLSNASQPFRWIDVASSALDDTAQGMVQSQFPQQTARKGWLQEAYDSLTSSSAPMTRRYVTYNNSGQMVDQKTGQVVGDGQLQAALDGVNGLGANQSYDMITPEELSLARAENRGELPGAWVEGSDAPRPSLIRYPDKLFGYANLGPVQMNAIIRSYQQQSPLVYEGSGTPLARVFAAMGAQTTFMGPANADGPSSVPVLPYAMQGPGDYQVSAADVATLAQHLRFSDGSFPQSVLVMGNADTQRVLSDYLGNMGDRRYATDAELGLFAHDILSAKTGQFVDTSLAVEYSQRQAAADATFLGRGNDALVNYAFDSHTSTLASVGAQMLSIPVGTAATIVDGFRTALDGGASPLNRGIAGFEAATTLLGVGSVAREALGGISLQTLRVVDEVPNSGELVFRSDNYLYSHQGAAPGRLKSYIDDNGNLVPANPNGNATVIDHIRGSEPRKSDSPYTSFSLSQSTEKSYGDTSFSLDINRLQQDINSGTVQNVEVINHESLLKIHDEAINKARVRYENNPSPKNLERLERAAMDKSNSVRDQEVLIKGVIPNQYLNF